MKKVLFLLFLLLNLNLYSQSIITVTHDSRLTETLWDFEKNMKKVNFDKIKIKLIKSIKVVPDYWLYKTYGSPCWALTRKYKDGTYDVYIGESVFLYKPQILNAVFYHEMFHVFAKNPNHCSGILCPDVINGEALNIKELESNWNIDKKLELLMYIKWNQNTN